jgi:hypothetical protein
MKIIILDGIATSGKTCLGNILLELLKKEKLNHIPVYFNNEIRSKYNLDILALKKDDSKRDSLNVRMVSDFFLEIVEKLEEIERKENKKYLFIIDRFHYSYIKSLGATPEDFFELENKIKDFSYYICLNFENPNSDLLYSRIKHSLKLRSEHPFTSRHFKRIVGNDKSEEVQKNLIWKHYGPRIENYDLTFEGTILKKKKLFVDKIIDKKDYEYLLTKDFKEEVLNFAKN